MKKFIITLLLFFLSFNTCFAMDSIDVSIDDEIRKKYNVSDDDISLPPLPNKDKKENKVETVEPSQKTSRPVEIDKTVPVINVKTNSKTDIVLKRGTKFKLKSLSAISDRTRKGSRVSFVLLYPVTTKYLTLPANTIIYGKVIKSHSPQLTGNGGLIKIKLDSVNINGKKYSLDGRVLKANSKHIFLNNIKGKRRYLASLPKSMKWGRNYKNKMYKLTGKLAKEKATIILCPFSAIFGTVGYAGNLILSPVIAIKYRGDRIILNKGTNFVFKLTEDVYIH